MPTDPDRISRGGYVFVRDSVEEGPVFRRVERLPDDGAKTHRCPVCGTFYSTVSTELTDLQIPTCGAGHPPVALELAT